MPKDPNEIEDLIESIRNNGIYGPSELEIAPETVYPDPEPPVWNSPIEPVTASGLILPLNSFEHNYPETQIYADGTVTLRNGPGPSDEYTIDLREQSERVQQLVQRVAMLENTVRLLGNALASQIDCDVMNNLTPEEKAELTSKALEYERRRSRQAKQMALPSQTRKLY